MSGGIAVAGTIAVDEIKVVERYPDKTELTTISDIKRSLGGAVANCSLALSKIDATLPIETLCILGEDEKGQYIYNHLKQHKNIDVSKINFKNTTPFTDVIQDKNDKTRTFYHFKGNASLFNEHTIDFTKLNSKILHVAYLLLLDGLDQTDDQYGTKMALLLKKAQDHGVKTSIDIVSENQERYQKIVPPSLKYTNYCVINEYEAGKTAGIPLRNSKGDLLAANIKDVLKSLKSFGVKDWVIIHAPEGSFGFDGKDYYSLPSVKIHKDQIKGTVGAGDAYVAGVLYGAYLKFSIYEAMKLGTITAATSLCEEDSNSGILNFDCLMQEYQRYPKHEEIKI
ncbi:carbohydrate kinase family protein [Gracilibacillus kekensis]|uniref:Sugar or nucleoside kinase, ribokinase family n=1 Tax=Gracilibacillus kekensis TaxID=1027249 RepID=A0A1M7JVG4_9BACI|nr:carbohydrate kinase family protein [Gracilibacillus kekensis]SHM56925.1 Sugar or nucleoside kinase, ribokinase family [Gracilibacillus kekensis]